MARFKPDVIYETVEGDIFVSPDGIGRLWYDSVDEAYEQHGTDLPVVVGWDDKAEGYDNFGSYVGTGDEEE